MKPQNLLINRENVLKIADFGLARAFAIPVKNVTHEIVTLWYRAPDILMGSNAYDSAVDMWSVGCIFAEMVTKKPLFPGKNEEDQLSKIFKIRGTPNADEWPNVTKLPGYKSDFTVQDKDKEDLSNYVPGLSPDGLDLLEQMLQLDPNKRYSAREALKHRYFRDVPEAVKNYGYKS